MAEPRYTKTERRARKREIDWLRRRAVQSWNADQVGNVAIVMMTFGEYLALVPTPPIWLTRALRKEGARHMRKKLLSVLLLIGLLSAGVQAQAATTQKLAWEQPGVPSVAAAVALTYRLQIDAAPAVTVPQTCTLIGVVVSCTTSLPPAGIAPLAPGPHTITFRISRSAG